MSDRLAEIAHDTGRCPLCGGEMTFTCSRYTDLAAGATGDASGYAVCSECNAVFRGHGHVEVSPEWTADSLCYMPLGYSPDALREIAAKCGDERERGELEWWACYQNRVAKDPLIAVWRQKGGDADGTP